MNRNRNYHPADDTDKKDVRMVQSSTCRRLFLGSPDVPAIPAELSKEARDEQRLRWNFDFMTETPLPGRYQWERAVPPTNNGAMEERKRSRSPTETQCPRPEKRLVDQRSPPLNDILEPAPVRRQPNEAPASTYGVDCT
ncbi:hypothetical protein JTE90_027618 [Oedothorax gibbosus]|uniref:Cyclin-dependent kinase inhibitor domain-containing protein n=1 Tax=Oedothorax gibbosus TaxID=931172 RepID=A0AAV6VLW6_9ARAC|nr:hypothetical protein JTE90_027618 [Oedothorax gibbosus]